MKAMTQSTRNDETLWYCDDCEVIAQAAVDSKKCSCNKDMRDIGFIETTKEETSEQEFVGYERP